MGRYIVSTYAGPKYDGEVSKPMNVEDGDLGGDYGTVKCPQMLRWTGRSTHDSWRWPGMFEGRSKSMSAWYRGEETRFIEVLKRSISKFEIGLIVWWYYSFLGKKPLMEHGV